MNFARVVRLDDTDENVFERAAEAGEWAIPGTFEFSNWTEAELEGKGKQAFSHGWLGLESFARASVVAVAPITEAERAELTERLAGYFVSAWGAPNLEAAMPVADEEIRHMGQLCSEQEQNALMVMERELTDAGVKERLRIVPPQGASLEAFAVHGD